MIFFKLIFTLERYDYDIKYNEYVKILYIPLYFFYQNIEYIKLKN